MADTLAERLAAIREHIEAAPAGPYKVDERHGRDIADEGWSEVRVVGPDGRPLAATFITSIIEPDDADDVTGLLVAARTEMPRLVAAVEAVLSKVHAPVPVYQIALHGHAPDPGASFTLHCGHPATALEDDSHAESDEGDWICLENVFRVACGGCRDDEGELADFGDCATRAAITRALTGEDGQ